jgi:uncharacterized protein YjbJ (UPF0337 family)
MPYLIDSFAKHPILQVVVPKDRFPSISNLKENAMSNHHKQAGNQSGDWGSQGDPTMNRDATRHGSSGDWGQSSLADIVSGQWNQIKGQIKQRWGQLTDDDLMQAQGNYEQLVGVIQQRTGQSRSTILDELQQMVGRQPESEDSINMGDNRQRKSPNSIEGSGYSDSGDTRLS